MNLITYLRLRAFGTDSKGQDLLEYALLVALIAVVAVTAVTAAGVKVEDVFKKIDSAIKLPAA